MEDKMEAIIVSDKRETTDNQQQATPRRRKGGPITLPFIIANESFEKVTSYGLVPNMILYLMRDYHLGAAKGTNIIFLWNAASNFMPILGAFLSDSYLGRFLTIGLGSIFSFLGTILLWLTTMIPGAKPSPCNQVNQTCESPNAAQMTLLISFFAFNSIGAGGIRPCSIAFGADQLDKRDNPKNKRVLERFFGLYYATAALAVLIALTGIVYIQDHLGWKVGFAVTAILMALSILLFFFASPFYVKLKASKSLFTGFAQVLVVAFKNRKFPLPPPDASGYYHHKKGSQLVMPTNKLRFLNKACVIGNLEQDIAPDGSALHPWSLCTTEQVEQLKALIKVVPLWSAGIIFYLNISQHTFPLLQASSMDRHISSSFQIPAGSFGTFIIIALMVWVLLYDRLVIPLASKIKGKLVQLGLRQRMGTGIFLSSIAMVVAGIVEHLRRKRAIREGHLNNGNAILEMSAMWLVPQYCLIGFAEAFYVIAQTEFYYSEFPKSMSSIGVSLDGLGRAVANLLASAIVNAVDNLTSKGKKGSWVSSNINKGRYDYYYWLLAIVSALNLVYFVLCSWAYGPSVDRKTSVRDEGNGIKDEEGLSNQGNNAVDHEGIGLNEEGILPKS